MWKPSLLFVIHIQLYYVNCISFFRLPKIKIKGLLRSYEVQCCRQTPQDRATSSNSAEASTPCLVFQKVWHINLLIYLKRISSYFLCLMLLYSPGLAVPKRIQDLLQRVTHILTMMNCSTVANFVVIVGEKISQPSCCGVAGSCDLIVSLPGRTMVSLRCHTCTVHH